MIWRDKSSSWPEPGSVFHLFHGGGRGPVTSLFSGCLWAQLWPVEVAEKLFKEKRIWVFLLKCLPSSSFGVFGKVEDPTSISDKWWKWSRMARVGQKVRIWDFSWCWSSDLLNPTASVGHGWGVSDFGIWGAGPCFGSGWDGFSDGWDALQGEGGSSRDLD